MLPFTKKYTPKSLSEIIGQPRAIQALSFRPRKPLLLYGPTGTGKTAAIHTLATDKNAELIEMSASNFRNKDAVERILKPAGLQASLFGTNKIILIDEIDGISGRKDRGAIPAIISVLKESKFPIYITANDPWHSKFSTLRGHCQLIQFNKLSATSIANHLATICRKESLEFEEAALRRIAAHADGDLRAAINDLQIMSTTGKISIDTLTIWGREQRESIFDALKVIFKSFSLDLALSTYNGLTEDHEQISFWIDHNLPQEYKNQDLRDAHRCVSTADKFRARIMRRQYWGFLVYIRALLSVGVQQAKRSTNPKLTRYTPHDMLKKIFIRASKRKKYRGLAGQFGPKLHSSSKSLQQNFIPYLEFIKEHNKPLGSEITSWLEK